MVAMAALDAGCRPPSNYARAGQLYRSEKRLEVSTQSTGPRCLASYAACREMTYRPLLYAPMPSPIRVTKVSEEIWPKTIFNGSASAAKAFSKAGSRRRGTRSGSVSSGSSVLYAFPSSIRLTPAGGSPGCPLSTNASQFAVNAT
jgi:hypothetical protein